MLQLVQQGGLLAQSYDRGAEREKFPEPFSSLLHQPPLLLP